MAGQARVTLAECSLNASSRPRDTSELSSAWVSLTSLSKDLNPAARNTNSDASRGSRQAGGGPCEDREDPLLTSTPPRTAC